ncbi:hypothetical protein C2S51_009704 [Perilla frutescens var. frutescens]|nr:hypothetical protein C2S51_009704 [Perilla frutescens var. frutescens]
MDNSMRSLPPLWRTSVLSPPKTSHSKKSELPASPNSRPVGPEPSSKRDLNMPSDSSQLNSLRHRRAHSDVLTLLSDISFDNELGVLGGLDQLSNPDEVEEDLLPDYLVLDKFNSTYEELSASASEAPAALSEKPRSRLQHSQSFAGVTCNGTRIINPASEDPSQAEADKSISAANLAELAVTDPKRAKRIWANRQSAARSKERKMRYITELQSKVQTLQSEKAALSMQFALMQSDTNGLASENIEFKLQLQSFEQQAQLQDALNRALKEEIQHLKVLTGQAMVIPNGQPSVISMQQQIPNQQYHHTKNINQPLMSTAQPMQHQFRQHQLDQFQPRQLLLH